MVQKRSIDWQILHKEGASYLSEIFLKLQICQIERFSQKLNVLQIDNSLINAVPGPRNIA